MDKREILIEFITQDVITKIAQEKGAEMSQAMNEFYSSAVFAKLQDYKTGLYLEGNDYIYDLLTENLYSGQ